MRQSRSTRHMRRKWQLWRIAFIPGKSICLLGKKFVVVTDNVANTFFKTQKKLSPKQARWQEFLQEDDFVWKSLGGTTRLLMR